MMNCDGFRPIKRTKVGRYGNMGGNAGIPLVPYRDEGFYFLDSVYFMYLLSVETWVAPRNSRPNDGVGFIFPLSSKYMHFWCSLPEGVCL